MAFYVMVGSISLLAVAAAVIRHDEGACTDATCGPTRHGRTLLQHVASATASIMAEEPGIKEYSREYIINTLMPQAEATTRELQNEVDQAAAAFDQCSVALAQEDQGLSQQEQTLITAEQRHQECEIAVANQNRSMGSICGDWEEFAAKLEVPVDAQEINGTNAAACLASLASMNTFYSQVYPQFMEKKKHCEVATSGEEVTKEQCDADKVGIQESWCSLKAARVQSCTTLDACYTAKSESFDTAVEYVELLQNNTKAHVEKHVEKCKEDKDCSAGVVDYTSLSVNYPVKPIKTSCVDTVKTDWDYSEVSCSA